MTKPEVVVITGATSGVGRATAQAFAKRGAHVALLARGRDGLEGAARDVEAAGGKALQLPTDVADYDQVEAAAKATEEAFGPIDIWVNDAMTTVFAELKDIEPDEYRRATEVTYLGQVWGVKAALSRMLPRDRGSIVLVGSAMAYRGIPLQSPYCGAKFAVRGMFESLRCELRHNGSKVRLSMVQLPGMNTPQFDHCLDKLPKKPQPVAPIYQPEVAAEAIYWSAHNTRRELYVGISAVYTIWGNKLAPWLAERYLARTAYSGQQTQQDVSPERKNNLFEPVPGDAGAHGDFDEKAHEHSIQEWLSRHRGAIGAAAAGVGAATAVGVAAAVR